MKPIYEQISPNIDSSFKLQAGDPCCEPLWHIHPEYELVYVRNGEAEIQVGASIYKYTDGLLLLVGSNVPHSNMGNNLHTNNHEVVVQIKPETIDYTLSQLPEFASIIKMMKRSVHGMVFTQLLDKDIPDLIEGLEKEDTLNRLLQLFSILGRLASEKNYKLLNTSTTVGETKSNDYLRMSAVYNFINEQYHRNISITELAKLTQLTETSFCRFFKKVSGQSFTKFLNEFRVNRACNYLANHKSTISEAMEISGFNDPAHFTRTFKSVSGYTPRAYQKKMQKWE